MKRNFLLMLLLTLLPFVGWAQIVEPGEAVEGGGYDDINVTVNPSIYYSTGNDLKTAVLSNLQVTGIPGSWDGGNFTPTEPDADPISLNQGDFQKKWYVWDPEGEYVLMNGDQAISEPGLYKVELTSPGEYWVFSDAEDANSAEFEVKALPFQGVALTSGTTTWDKTKVVGTSEETSDENRITVSTANDNLTLWYFSGEPESEETDPVKVENAVWYIQGESGWTVLEGEFTFAVGQYKAVRPGDGVTSEYAVTFNVIANPLVEVQVSPTNTQTLFYGTPVDKLKVTPLFFSITEPAFLTDAGRQQIADVLIFKNAEALSTADVGTVKYTLNLNKKSNLYDATTGKLIITKDGTDYNIVPLGMQGDVDILKGKNELVKVSGKPIITVKKDLKYTAAAQVLVNIPTEGEGADAKPAKVATLGGVQYFAISVAKYEKAYQDAAVADALENNPDLTDEQIADIREQTVAPAAGEYNFPEEGGVLNVTWTEQPEGTEVGEYFVWVKTLATSNYDGEDPVLLDGKAKINPGDPTIAGTITGVADKYYLKTTEGNNWKHIYTTNEGPAIVPGGEFTATIGGVTKPVPAANVSFQVQKGTKDADGNIIWEKNDNGTDKTYPIWSNYGNSFGSFTVGFYRVRVAIANIPDFSERVGGGQSEPYKVFEVVNPTYQIVTTSNPTPATIPYDNQASVTFGYRVEHTGYAPEFTPAAPNAENQSNYTWYTSDGSQAEKTNGKYAAGEYNVKINDNLFTASEDFVKEETVAAPVSILAGLIMATIENQELVYGQTLPLYLTFDSGSGIAPTDTRAINEFNNTRRRNGFTATLIKDAEGKDVTDAEPIALRGHGWGENYWTDLLPVGTYKVSGNFGGDETNRILASSATWKVTPKDIANEDFNNPGVEGMRNRDLDLHKTYTSNPIELTAGDLNEKFTYRNRPLVLGEDFEITDYANNVNAGTATFTITGKGNFTGTRENRRFTIDKAKIYVFPAILEDEEGNPQPQTWAVGTPEVKDGKSIFTVDWDSEDEVTIEDDVTVKRGIYAQLQKFEQDRKKKRDMAIENGFKDLAARRTVPANADYYKKGLIAYLPEGAAKADNYEFVMCYGPLQIEKGTIKIQLADQETDYAFVEPTITTKKFELANADDLNAILAENLKANLNSVIVSNLDKVNIVKDWNTKKQEVTIEGDETKYYRYPVGNYPFTAEVPEGAFTATNFNIVVVPRTANLTVNPVEITVKAENQTVNYADFLDEDGAFDADAKEEYIEGITEVKPANVAVNPELKGEDQLTDVIASLSVNTDNEIVVALVNPENPNYTVTNIDDMNGTLTVKALPGIALLSEAATYDADEYGDPNYDADGNLILTGGDLKTIKDKDGMPVNYVTIKLKAATLDPANEAYSQWKAYEWHAMVLPFATTVGEVAYNFGYAVVNVVDEEGTEASTKPNEVKFKLQEMEDEIPANTPFLIKAQYDFDYNNTLLYFGNIDGSLAKAQNDVKPILIEYDPNPSVPAGRGITFDGTYDQKVFDNTTTNYKFLGPDSKWKRYTASSTSKYTMQPYTSYLNLGGFTGTREVVVIVEEEDGSTTAINAAELQNLKSAEGLYRIDGIKVQGAPTQKGVYIQDGKKFVK